MDPLTTSIAPKIDIPVSGSTAISEIGISWAMAMVNSGVMAMIALTLEASRCTIASAKHPYAMNVFSPQNSSAAHCRLLNCPNVEKSLRGRNTRLPIQ